MRTILRKFWIVATGSILIEALLLGCHGEKSSAANDALRQQRHDVGQQRQQLVYKYLEGDVVQARESLEQSVKLIEGETVLSPLAHAAFLQLDYGRLSVLEKRVGNESASNAFLAKARNWEIKDMELAEVPADKIKERIKLSNAEQIVGYVNDSDKGENNGNLPKYVQSIQNK